MQRRVPEHVHERLTGWLALHTPVLLDGNDDDFFTAVNSNSLWPFSPGFPNNLAEAGFGVLEGPSSST